MKAGHTRQEVDRVLQALTDAMRAVTARTTVTYDNQLSVAQKLIVRSFEGWDAGDIPANVPLLMRDLAVCHDDQIDREINRIVDAFELAQKWIKEATGYDDEEAEQSDPADDQPIAMLVADTCPPPVCSPPETPPTKNKKKNGKHGNVLLKKVVSEIFREVDAWSRARTLDELIVECTARGSRADREQVAAVVRTMSTDGLIVEVDLPSGPAYVAGISVDGEG